MRLAASQRQHAPPVPPRPSKQVVAEALKKTGRLPCPTRQAPPPPNTRPWRPGDDAKTLNKDKSINNDKSINTTESIKQVLQNDAENILNNKLSQDNDKMHESSNNCQKTSLQDTQMKIKHLNNPSNLNNYENVTINHENINNNSDNNVNNVNSDINNEINDRQVKKIELEDINLLNKTESIEQHNKESSEQILKSDLNKFLIQSTIDLPLKTTVLVTINKNDSNISVTSQDAGQSAMVSNNNDCTTVVVIDRPKNKITINNDKDENKENIHKQDWLEEGIHYSSTKITLMNSDDDINNFNNQLENHHHHYYFHDKNKIQSDFNSPSVREKIIMASLQGLPPLPRSLSGLYLNEGLRENNEPPLPPTRSSSKMSKIGMGMQSSNSRRSSPGRQFITLDTQLTVLKKEMFGLRQLDLSILSQLWSLNESIQEFRQILQDHEDRVPSPSPSSEEGDDLTYINHPAAPPRRVPSLHHHHHYHHHHHHRPPRPPRPLRPLPSDESPSSEEYGAV